MTSETTLFSARRWGFIWLSKFLLMWQWERISNSCPECDSYISSSSVTSFTPPSPHHCHSNRPGINITSWLIFFFHPERDVGLQWRKWVLALTPFKRCFRFQTDDLVCTIHHPVKDFVFSLCHWVVWPWVKNNWSSVLMRTSLKQKWWLFYTCQNLHSINK